MNRTIKRRVFIKKSAAATLGAMVLPGSVFIPHLGKTVSESENRQDHDLVSQNIDWKEMMKNHDLIWTRLPSDMREAPHFGNGLIGSMIWFEDNAIRLQVFRADVHDHADHTYGWTAYSRPRYQIGYFIIKPQGDIIDCDLRQDIYHAELVGTIHTSLGMLKISHFVHRYDDVICTEIEVTREEVLGDVEWHPFEARTSRGGGPGDPQYGGAYAPYKALINPDHKVTNYGEIYTGLQDLTAGGDYATAWKQWSPEANKSMLLIAIENTYPEKASEERAIGLIKSAEEKIRSNAEIWRERHVNWWHAYYPESYVTFPDTIGETFYWTNVYRLACCTRPGAQYIDTPGMWNSGGPWPYSTHDFNTQTAHFPVYTANRLHLGEALVESLYRNQKNLIDNVVPADWQEDSSFLTLATAYDLRGKRDGDARYSEMMGCLTWLLNNCWLHYRYTMDKEMLREKVLPILRRSINFYRHLLYRGDDGKIHLPPTHSPELGNFTDCSFDLALLRWGCIKLIEICRILDTEDPLLSEWVRITDELVEYPVDENGYMIGRERTGPQDHQHMSHLMMIYPLFIENIEESEDINLLKRSVINYQPVSMPKMAASQSSPAAAALGLGNLALQRMNDILYREVDYEVLGKNGIYYLRTPCIETSLSYNTCVQDMLLQSWGNKIRVFPALPDSWQDVAFHNFRAEGAFLVSAKRQNGKTMFVRIKSLVGEPCIVQLSFDSAPRNAGYKEMNIQEVGLGCYKIDLKKGEEIVLYQGDTTPDFVIEPLSANPDVTNYFGVRK